jgi:hypothetical protein
MKTILRPSSFHVQASSTLASGTGSLLRRQLEETFPDSAVECGNLRPRPRACYILRHPMKNYRAGALTLDVRTNLQQAYEHLTRHDRRMGRPQNHATGTEWARPVPMVHAGSAGTPLHLLFRLLRTRVEAAFAAGVLTPTHF